MINNVIAPVFVSAAERRWVSDPWLRRGIRYLCQKRLQNEQTSDAAGRRRKIESFVQECRETPVALETEKANEQHYEVPASFYQQVLGSNLKYSCCYFDDAETNLDHAEEKALHLSCEHAELEDGMSVLELGCGWGSLTLWMLKQYPNLKVTAVSNSNSQRVHIESQAAARGFSDRLNVITCDINQLTLTDRFDRVVSVEMFEHVRNHSKLLERVSNWLVDDGKLFVHIFCHKNTPYAFTDEGATSWMARHFFTGGVMPHAELFDQYQDHMVVNQTWKWSGVHYQRTAEAWLKRMDENLEEIRPVMHEGYGRDAERSIQRWRMFFLAVAELFGFNDGNEWFVQHYLFHKAK